MQKNSRFTLFFSFLLLLSLLIIPTYADSTIYDVQTGNTYGTPTMSQQTHAFDVDGTMWAVWTSATAGATCGVNVKSSTDNGATWSASTNLFSTSSYSSDCDFYFDGTYVSFVTWRVGQAYRRGIFNANGTITWSAGLQTTLSSGNYATEPSLTVNSTGFAYVLWTKRSTSNTYVTINSNNDGTFSGTDYLIDTANTVSTGNKDGAHKIFTYGNKAYCFYSGLNIASTLRFNILDGTTPDTAISAVTDMKNHYLWDAVQDGTNIYITYLDLSQDFQFMVFDCVTETFSESEEIGDGQSDSAPMVIFDGQEECVHTFWAEGSSFYDVKYDTNTQIFADEELIQNATMTDSYNNYYFSSCLKVTSGSDTIPILYFKLSTSTVRYFEVTLNATRDSSEAETPTAEEEGLLDEYIDLIVDVFVPLFIILFCAFLGFHFAEQVGFIAGLNIGVMVCVLCIDFPVYTLVLMVVVDTLLFFRSS